MNFDMFEQWLCTFILPKRQRQVLRVVQNIQEKPVMSFLEGLQAMEPFQESDAPMQGGALLVGLLLGITIYHSWMKDPKAIEEILQGYLDRNGSQAQDLINKFMSGAKKK